MAAGGLPSGMLAFGRCQRDKKDCHRRYEAVSGWNLRGACICPPAALDSPARPCYPLHPAAPYGLSMKTYTAEHTDHGVAIVVANDGEYGGLNPHYDLHRYSPQGFAWGPDAGAGAAQLALALAADVLGNDKRALNVHQRLKSMLVSRLPDEGWVLTDESLRAAIEAVEQTKARSR